MIETYLPRIISALKSTHGETFFNIITLELNNVIAADYTFIARLDSNKRISKTISMVAKGQLAENFDYSLDHTPCSDVSQDQVCIYPTGICNLYPQDQLLIDMHIDGYIGTPLHDSNGNVMGLIVALYEQPIATPEVVVSLFELFSGRVSVEIERTEKEEQLEKLANSLDLQVRERTIELTEAVENLKMAQQQIIEQEKFALLGKMVAGVAHEINTPLGIAVLGASNINDICKPLLEKVTQGQLKKSELESDLHKLIGCGDALNINLARASELIHNFKQVSVENASQSTREIHLPKFFSDLRVSIQPIIDKRNTVINLPSDNLTFVSDQSRLTQIFINLITNCLQHAFAKERGNKPKVIDISVVEDETSLCFTVKDNGDGMDEKIKKRIFEPFFTTNRSKGGPGLGLNIVYNVVKRALNGDISVDSAIDQGTTISITLPKLGMNFTDS